MANRVPLPREDELEYMRPREGESWADVLRAYGEACRRAALALHKSCYADLDAALSRESAVLSLLCEFMERDWHRGTLMLDTEDRVRIEALVS